MFTHSLPLLSWHNLYLCASLMPTFLSFGDCTVLLMVCLLNHWILMFGRKDVNCCFPYKRRRDVHLQSNVCPFSLFSKPNVASLNIYIQYNQKVNLTKPSMFSIIIIFFITDNCYDRYCTWKILAILVWQNHTVEADLFWLRIYNVDLLVPTASQDALLNWDLVTVEAVEMHWTHWGKLVW